MKRNAGPLCPKCQRKHGKLLDTREQELVDGSLVFYRLRLYAFPRCLPRDRNVLVGAVVLNVAWPKRCFPSVAKRLPGLPPINACLVPGGATS